MFQYINVILPFLPYIALTILIWITYVYTLKCGFVSDDIAGIAEYNGLLQTRSTEAVLYNKNLSKEEKETRLKELNKRSLLRKLLDSEYGMISRWARYWVCGGNFPSKHRFPDKQTPDGKIIKGDFIPCGKVARRHHILSIVIFNLSIISTYHFLFNLFGPDIAFLTCALFIVHPVVTQGVAWCSGLGYFLSLFWITLGLNLTFWYYTLPAQSLIVIILILMLFAIIQILAINALFIALASWIILVFLGYYPFALIAFLISVLEGLKIVRYTIQFRADEFKKQSMGASTYLKPRKIIVAVKTFAYYLKHALCPNRMGLYHKWGSNYDDGLEREDKYFFMGIALVASIAAWFFLTPAFEIRFGILWFVSFLFIFLNWITVQQFVTERYLMVPTIGICIIMSFLLKTHIEIYLLIFGMYLVRSWLHLPTYDNELRFYLSNTWNFSNSEVALGNLGVTYVRMGQIGSALDHWHEAISANPDYDVPYYNIYSHYRTNAMFNIEHGNFSQGIEILKQAAFYLEKCVNCKICHFGTDWKKELEDVKLWIENPMKLVLFEEKRLIELRSVLSQELSDTKDPKRREEIIPSLNDIARSLGNITKIKKANPESLYAASSLTEDSLIKNLLT